MADLLTLIYDWFFYWFIEPINAFIDNWAQNLPINSPVVITMPGSNVPMLTLELGDIFVFGGAVFLFIGSIICFIALLKFFYKMGKRLFGGRR